MLKPFKEDDYDLFIDMCKDFYSGEAVLHEIPEVNIKRTFKEILRGSPYVKGHFIYVGEAVAGYGLHWLYWSNEAGGLVCFLDELYIKPAYRGQRLGTLFIEALRDIYEDQVVGYRLEVSEENQRASRLYERLGFEFLNYSQMIDFK